MNQLEQKVMTAKTVTTHEGDFHADETIACAILLKINPELQITRDRTATSADIVVDCGFLYDKNSLRFDHHQKEGAGKRENNIPYASAGLVWKDLGSMLVDQANGREVLEIVDQKLIQWVDATDNGMTFSSEGPKPYTIFDIIRSYGTNSVSPNEKYNEFMEAVGICGGIIGREIRNAKIEVANRQVVRDVFAVAKTKGSAEVVHLPTDKSWQHVAVVEHPDSKYVLYHRQDNTYAVRAVPTVVDGFQPRLALPENWRGLSGEQLQTVTGVSDAVFCHRGGFLASAKSITGAYELANKSLVYASRGK